MNLLPALALVCASVFSATGVSAQSLTMGQVDQQASGLSLAGARDKTLVGITRDSSRIWSVYLGRDGTAHFTFSSGSKQSGTWSQKSRNIICFKGLVKERPTEEVCKLATPRGRGMDWMSIKITSTRDNTVMYDKETPAETAGSSQIVLAYSGRQTIDATAPARDPRAWRGRVVVGRTLKDKEVFFMRLGDTTNEVDFVFASGRRLVGQYALRGTDVCMTFPTARSADSCKRPVWDGRRLLWQTPETGQSVSEIVYVTPKVSRDAAKPATAAPKPAPAPAPEAPKPHAAPLAHFSQGETYDSFTVSADGELIAGIDKTARLWLVSATRRLAYLPFSLPPERSFSNTSPAAQDVAMDATGSVIAYRFDNVLSVMRRDGEGTFLRVAPFFPDGAADAGPPPKVTDLAVARDGSRLAALADTGLVAMLDARNGQEIWKVESAIADAQRIAISRDGQLLAVGGKTGGLQILSAADGAARARIDWLAEEISARPSSRAGSVNALIFAPDGNSLAVGTHGGRLARFDITGEGLVRRYQKSFEAIHDLAFLNLSGSTRLVAAIRNAPVQVFNYANGERDLALGAASKSAVSVDALGQTGGLILTANPGGGLSIWALTETGKELAAARQRRAAETFPAARRDMAEKLNAAFSGFEARNVEANKLFDAGACEALSAAYQPREIRLIEFVKGQTCAERQRANERRDLDRAVAKAIEDGDCAFVAANVATLSAIGQDGLNPDETLTFCTAYADIRRLAQRIDDLVLAGACDSIPEAAPELMTLYITVESLGAEAGNQSVIDAAQRSVNGEIAAVTEKCTLYALFERASAMEMFMGGVRFEAEGSPDAARALYSKLLQRFPNDSVAMKTAERVLELVDKSGGSGLATGFDHGPVPASPLHRGGFFAPSLPPLK